jgi:hypothetical protein
MICPGCAFDNPEGVKFAVNAENHNSQYARAVDLKTP